MTFKRLEKEKHIGSTGLEKLRNASIVVVGIGALGTRVAQLLGSLGVGSATLIDRDIVTEDNLYTQPLFFGHDLGLPKAMQAAAILQNHFTKTNWKSLDIDLNSSTINKLQGDLIFDCSDNLAVRYLINEYCVKNKKTWVHGSAIGSDGQTAAFLPGSSCFRCLLPDGKALETCETAGILPTTASLVASLQSTLALRILLGERPDGILHRAHGWEGSVIQISFTKRRDCPVCISSKFELLEREPDIAVSLCGGGVFQATITAKEAKTLSLRAEKSWPGGFILGPLRVFEDGRVLILANSEGEAKAKLASQVPN